MHLLERCPYFKGVHIRGVPLPIVSIYVLYTQFCLRHQLLVYTAVTIIHT